MSTINVIKNLLSENKQSINEVSGRNVVTVDQDDIDMVIKRLQKAKKLIDSESNPSVAKLSDDWELDNDDFVELSDGGSVTIATEVYNVKTGKDKTVYFKIK